jgi:hypothetical protein
MGTKITIGGDGSYREKITKILRTIRSYWPGSVLLDEIEDALDPKSLTISPRTPEDIQKMGVCNADATPDSYDALVTAQTESQRFDGTGKGAGDEPPDTPTANVGSDVTILFDPNQWMRNDHGGRICPASRGMGPDETLLHELCHSLRALQGIDSQQYPLGGNLAAYQNEEEFIAVHYTNTYVSAKFWLGPCTARVAGPDLRGGHAAQTLDPKYCTSEGFLNNPEFRRVVIRQSSNSLPLWLPLIGGNADFNPFGEFVANYQKWIVP